MVHAIIKVESNYKANAVSKNGDIGLMQINPKVWEKELKKVGIIKHRKDLFNPEKNVASGRYILAKMIGKRKTLEGALIAYSGGDRNYPKRVMKHMDIL